VDDPTPIVCTLSAKELEDRELAWQKLLGSGLVARSRVPGGIRLTAEQGAATALRQLIDLERECCPWIKFDVSSQSSVTLTAGGEGEAVLLQMFQLPDEDQKAHSRHTGR
jgi:hypothetical protein